MAGVSAAEVELMYETDRLCELELTVSMGLASSRRAGLLFIEELDVDCHEVWGELEQLS